MWTDLLSFLQSEWNLISAHPWSFFMFGTFLFLIGFSISWGAHNYFLEIKLHNIPDREALQNQVAELQAQNLELQKALHRQDINELIHELQDGSEEKTLGEVISRNM